MFGNPVYSLDGSGPSMKVSVQHEAFFNSAFGICIGGKHVSDSFCRPTRMQEVWRSFGLRQHRMEQLSSLIQEIAIRRARVVHGKHGMEDLMLVLKEAQTKAEYILVHLHQGHTELQQTKDKKETPTLMLHTVHIN